MIVPSFWSEARKRHESAGKQITVRRFGWSEASEQEAQQMAERRAEEALQEILSGKKVRRRERKLAYNGADGVPIREEILSRVGPEIITRNSYGAHCLNSPRVLIADIDFEGLQRPSIFSKLQSWFRGRTPESAEELSLRRIKEFLDQNPSWNCRVYKTPGGLRLIATHKMFQARDPEVLQFFRSVNVDVMYERMCLNQNCFRARLTAKPWRIGIDQHMRPRPGIWPVHPERVATRNAWIQKYETRQKEFAACRFVKAMGSGTMDRDVIQVIKLHDEESRALLASLPIG